METELTLAIVEEAKSWINTPWGHQGNIKGVRVDCANFISACVIAAVNKGGNLQELSDQDIPNNYRRQENGDLLKFLLNKYLDYVDYEDRQPGDVLAFCDENLSNPDVPRHLVIISEVTPATTFVIDPTQYGVRRHRLNQHFILRAHSLWRVRPIVSTGSKKKKALRALPTSAIEV